MPQAAVMKVACPPTSAAAGALPEAIDAAQFVPSFAKKMKDVTVYGVAAASKYSTKWKKHPRTLVVTGRMVLVCSTGGEVKRVIDLSEIEELVVQQEKAAALLLIKLMVLPSNEPDLLVLSSHDATKNSHDPYALAAVIAGLAQLCRPGGARVPVRHLPESGPIRGMARLAHNPVSAKEKLKKCSSSPYLRPARAPLSTVPLNTSTQSDLSGKGYGDASGMFALPFDSRATSDASDSPPLHPAAPTCTDLFNASMISLAEHPAPTALQAPAPTSAASQAPSEPPQPKPKALPEPQLSTGIRRSLDAEPRVAYNQIQPFGHAEVVPPSRRYEGAPSKATTLVAPVPLEPVAEKAAAGGWTEHRDPTSLLAYYHNEATGVSTWHEPEELRAQKANPAPREVKDEIKEDALPEKPQHEARRAERAALPPRSRSGSTGVPFRPGAIRRGGRPGTHMPSFHEEDRTAQQPQFPVEGAARALPGPISSKGMPIHDPLLRNREGRSSRFGLVQGAPSPSSCSDASVEGSDSGSDMAPTPPRGGLRASSLRRSSARGGAMNQGARAGVNPPVQRKATHGLPSFEEVAGVPQAQVAAGRNAASPGNAQPTARRASGVAAMRKLPQAAPRFAEEPCDDLDL